MRSVIRIAMILAAALALPHAGLAASPGETAFQICRGCHAVDSGQTGFGPNLAGVVGRKAGAEPGYAYSPALAKAGFAWTRERLDAFLAHPDAVVPGTKMALPGTLDPAQRKAIIDFLATRLK